MFGSPEWPGQLHEFDKKARFALFRRDDLLRLLAFTILNIFWLNGCATNWIGGWFIQGVASSTTELSRLGLDSGSSGMI